MRILVLDDIEYRHKVFDQVYQGDTIDHAYTYTDFCNKLQSGRYDLVHLDHDLGDFVTGDRYIDGWGHSREYNGQHAAMKVCEMQTPPSKVIIHSVNPGGSRAMLQMLTRAGIPTTWDPFTDPAFSADVE